MSLPVTHLLSQGAAPTASKVKHLTQSSKIKTTALACLSEGVQVSAAKEKSSRAHDAKLFFAGFEGYDSRLFKPEHIEHLHYLMRENALGGYVHFFDLIGLECVEILEQSRLFLSQESYKNFEEAWHTIHMQWVFGSLRTHLRRHDVGPITEYTSLVFVAGQFFIDMITLFSDTFYNDLDRQFQEKLSKTTSKTIAQRLIAESVKIPLLKARWQKNMDLIETIISSPDRGALFSKMILKHFPQFIEKKHSSLDEAQEGLKLLHKLCGIFQKGLLLSEHKQMNTQFFQDIMTALHNVIEAKPKGLERAIDHFQQQLKDKEVFLEFCGKKMSDQMVILKDALETFEDPLQKTQIHKNYEQQIFQLLLNYHSELIINKIAAQVDVTLVPFIKKDHVPRIAWIDRAFTGIRFIMERDIPIALIQAAAVITSDSPAWKKHISRLRLEYSLKVFSFHELLSYLDKSRYDYGYLRLFFDQGVSCFSLELKQMVQKNLEHLETILEEFLPSPEELTQETLWLTKLLMLEHDLNVLLGEHEPKDEEDILAPYLHLLDKVYYQPATKKAKELEIKLQRQQLQKEAEDELAELVAHIDMMDIHLGQVHSKLPKQQPSEKVEKKATPQPSIIKSGAARPAALVSSKGKFTEEEAENFKHWKNASVTMVEKKLREIGLVFLRQKGSHRHYGLQGDSSVRTTLAFHPGRPVPLSILNKIVKQVGITDLS